MSIRMKRIATGVGLGKLSNPGIIKISILLCLLAVFMFVIFAVGAQKTAAADCDCNTCHNSFQHPDGWNGCSTSTCHDSPPQTVAHLTHYNSTPVIELVYGDTAVSSGSDAYKFGCGNCHPLDNSYHRNGTVEVQMYDAAAPAGSLKAKNPATAAYNPADKTCSNVYCHSGFVVFSSGPVGNPLTVNDNPALFPPNYKINKLPTTVGFIMDETCSSVQYAPYTVNSGREYKTTPAWGTTGTFSQCTECHQFPLTTFGPAVEAGVGDGHQWYNEWEGWAYGHANNMDYYPGIPCATCHYGTADHLAGTVANPPTASPTYWTQANGVWVKGYYPVQLKSRVMHVNGNPDVSFDTVNGYRYYYPNWINQQVSLTAATYNPATKTCSDVACHYGPPMGNHQKEVKWGSPYRGWYGPDEECDQCHRFGNLSETCTTP